MAGSLFWMKWMLHCHFEIVVSLIRIFNNKDINKNNAQLIFNTHNPIYLDGELLRHDQIVMVKSEGMIW